MDKDKTSTNAFFVLFISCSPLTFSKYYRERLKSFCSSLLFLPLSKCTLFEKDID
ncbi:hypothetical protein CLOSCI_02818 [[Clostridium] scindens ATCC 35704]|nr:hypothetical protein CLOSCI_02818 [[Clostridium] scindens ATCC 35704]